MTTTRPDRLEPTHLAGAGEGPRPARSGRALRAAPWALAGGGILTQVAFPLTGGGTLTLTVLAVVLLAAAALGHALVAHGPGVALGLLGTAGVGAWAAEALGLWTDVPFGAYDYTGTLGHELLGVPLLVPLAWVMMAWPALAAARRLVGHRSSLAVAAVGSWALTAWDVFLDPQMVEAGHWAWEQPSPALPGSPGIPLTNYAGWLVVSFVVVLVLDRLVPRPGRPADARDALPLTVYLWTYASSVMANAVFFGRPAVALLGAVLMGGVAVPLAVRLWRARTPGGRHR